MIYNKWQIEGNNLKIEIAGLAYHILPKQKECGKFDGYILPEPTNAYDDRAIKICKDNGKDVGYIPRDLTELVRMAVGERKYPCKITIEPVFIGGELTTIDGFIILENVNVYALNAYRASVFEPTKDNAPTYNQRTYSQLFSTNNFDQRNSEPLEKEQTFYEKYSTQIKKSVIAGVVILSAILAIFVVYPWAQERSAAKKEAEAKQKVIDYKQSVEDTKRNQGENAITMAAESEMLIMNADNGLRFDMTEKKLEKHIISMVRSGNMPSNNSINFKLRNGKAIYGLYKSYCTYGLLYRYELEFYFTEEDKLAPKDAFNEIVATIDSLHNDFKRYYFEPPQGLSGCYWIKDNMVIECYFDNSDPVNITLTYKNQPIAYNASHGNQDYVKSLCKSLLPMRDAHVHNMKKYGGVVMQVRQYMIQNERSYESVEWGPVVKHNNAYYVRHMYYTYNAFHEKVLNNCMFRMDLDGEVTDVYAITGTKYVFE